MLVLGRSTKFLFREIFRNFTKYLFRIARNKKIFHDHPNLVHVDRIDFRNTSILCHEILVLRIY
jgi:hypothetical protein